VHLLLYFDIIRGSADIWKLQFKNCLSDSEECLEFVRRFLDFSVLKGKLCFVFQVFGVCSSIIGPFGSQGRAVFRSSSVRSSFVDYWTVRFSGGELRFVFQVFRVRSSIIELFGFQGRALLRVSIVWSSFVDYWNVRFSRESCASLFKCSELVRRLLNCSILRGELRFVFQVFGVRSSIIGLLGSQARAALRVSSVWRRLSIIGLFRSRGRAALRVSGVWIDLCDYWTDPFSKRTLFCVWMGFYRFN